MILKLVLNLFIISCIFDPADKIFGIKTLLYLLLVFILFIILFSKKTIIFDKIDIYYLLVIYTILAISFFIGTIRNVNFNNNIAYGYLKSFLFLVLLIFINVDRNIFRKILINMLLVLSYSIIIIFLLKVFKNEYIDNLSSYLTFEVESAKIGTRQYGSYTLPMIYFKTSPLILFAIAYFIKKHTRINLIISILCLIAMILSGTRANIIIGFAFFSVSFFIIYKKYRKAAIIIFTLIIILFLPKILINFFSVSEYSNTIKINHIYDYIKLFDTKTILFGQGIGSGFMSTAFHGLTYNTELTYFEIIRIFGLLLGTILIIFIILPGILLYKNDIINSLAYFSYLIIAGTNPLLISSTGMIAIIYTILLNKDIM